MPEHLNFLFMPQKVARVPAVPSLFGGREDQTTRPTFLPAMIARTTPNQVCSPPGPNSKHGTITKTEMSALALCRRHPRRLALALNVVGTSYHPSATRTTPVTSSDRDMNLCRAPRACHVLKPALRPAKSLHLLRPMYGVSSSLRPPRHAACQR